MSTVKFQGKYRIPSARLQFWDYSWDGAYFVTICTHNMRPFFGTISENEMCLSPIGEIAQKCWQAIPDHSHNIALGGFVVMPNHIHGILRFDQQDCGGEVKDGKDKICAKNKKGKIFPKNGKDKACLVSTGAQFEKSVGVDRRRNQGKNTLSSIIGSYKSAVSKYAHQQNMNFAWQPRFYDHIIRTEQSHEFIANYIITNPANWQKDKFFIPQTPKNKRIS